MLRKGNENVQKKNDKTTAGRLDEKEGRERPSQLKLQTVYSIRSLYSQLYYPVSVARQSLAYTA